MSGPVDPLEQAYGERCLVAVQKGVLPLLILSKVESENFSKGSLYKILRKYVIHSQGGNFVALVATYGDADLGNGPKFLGLIVIGPFFSLRDPHFSHLNLWTKGEYAALRNDRMKLMGVTLKAQESNKRWESPFFTPLKVQASTFAFRVQMILALPEPSDAKKQQWVPEKHSFASAEKLLEANGELDARENPRFFQSLQNLLEPKRYNKYNARPFQVFGPQVCVPTPLSQEEFNLLFYGGISSSQASGFLSNMLGSIMDTPLPLVSSVVGLEPGIVRVALDLSSSDISFLVHYLKSKALACAGGQASTSPIATWFGVAVISNVTFKYRLSSQDVQPPDAVTAKLFAMVSQEVNRMLKLPIPFQVDAVQAHMLPAHHQAANVTVHFPFEDESSKDPFFRDTVRAVLFVFESPQDPLVTSADQHPPVQAAVEESFVDLMAQAAAAAEPSDVSFEPATDSTFRIPRVFSEEDTALKLEVKFAGVQSLVVGNGQLVVLTGDIAASAFRLFKTKKHMGFRGVFVFHQLDINTIIRTNRNLKRCASDQPAV